MSLTDEELGREIWPDDPEAGAKLAGEMAAKTPAKRETLERLIALADEINLWQAGLGPKPAGAIICGPRQIKLAGRTPKYSRGEG